MPLTSVASLPFALVAALGVAQAPPAPTPDDLSWLAGYWLSCEEGREVSETWSDPRGGLMVGSALTLSRGRVSFEAARIGPMAPDRPGLAYLAQPGGAPATAFRAVSVEETRAVFENPDNDFPQRVIYHRQGEALTARIEGRMDGRDQAMEWRFDRAELNARCPS